MQLFSRRWRCRVGTLQTTNVDVTFKIERHLTGRAGTCELKLFNLSPDHRSELHGLPRGTIVQVEAGYADGMSMLFRGDSRRINNRRDGTDWITEATAGEGEFSIRTARAARSFAPGTQIGEVVRYLAGAMGLDGTGNIASALNGRVLDGLDAILPEGVVLHGHVAPQLSSLLRSLGLTWSVQGGVLQVIPRGGALGRSAVLLRAGSGLVDSPERGQHGIVTAKALLIPDLVPGQRVQLESAVISGLYRIEKVEYSGASQGADWHAQMDLRENRAA